MDNLNNIKNLNNTDNTNNLDNIENAITEIDIINSYLKLIADYIDFKDAELSNNKSEDAFLTLYSLKRTQPSILNLCYEVMSKLDDVSNVLTNSIK